MSSLDASVDGGVLPLSDLELLREASLPSVTSAVKRGFTMPPTPAASRANRALLRLFQMYPKHLDADLVVAVLVKSLTALPQSDFHFAMYMVPERLHADARIVALAELEKLLQCAKFSEFWAMCKVPTTRALLNQVSNFDDAVRMFILHAINRTFQTVELATLAAALDLADASAFVTAHGWKVDGKQAVAPVIPENSSRPKKSSTEDSVRFHEIAEVMTLLSR